MRSTYNVYCDESCHLEHDRQKCMVLGSIWCPQEAAHPLFKRIREIKKEHGLSSKFEIKWTKVSMGKLQFYMDLLDLFFDVQDLHFRGLVVPDKSSLNHEAYLQTHDDWYYKMYFDLLKVIIDPTCLYNIFLDYKDTRGHKKSQKLREILENAKYDRAKEVIQELEPVRSDQVELIQLTDLLTGIVSYANRGLSFSVAKSTLVARMRQRSRCSLTNTTFLREQKVNLLCWEPTDRG